MVCRDTREVKGRWVLKMIRPLGRQDTNEVHQINNNITSKLAVTHESTASRRGQSDTEVDKTLETMSQQI